MSGPEFRKYLCADDASVDDDFDWERDGEPVTEYSPDWAAERFVGEKAKDVLDGLGGWRVVVLDTGTGEITRWNVEVEITYTVHPVKG